MNADDMVRAIAVLSETYGGHSWIDFDIVPGIAVALLEEFPNVDREEVLAKLDAVSPDGWKKGSTDRVRKHFGPRCFIIVEKGGLRRYWNSDRRALFDQLEDATRFEDEEEAIQVSKREGGPVGSEDAQYLDAVVKIERIEYPEWSRCENLP